MVNSAILVVAVGLAATLSNASVLPKRAASTVDFTGDVKLLGENVFDFACKGVPTGVLASDFRSYLETDLDCVITPVGKVMNAQCAIQGDITGDVGALLDGFREVCGKDKGTADVQPL